VDGPFGVVSATELIGIVLFVVYVIWAVYAYTTQILSVISQSQLTLKQKRYNILYVFRDLLLPFLVLVALLVCHFYQQKLAAYFHYISYLKYFDTFIL